MTYKLTQFPNQILRITGTGTALITEDNTSDWTVFLGWIAEGNTPLPADPLPPLPPNWEALKLRLLGGDLHPIFQRLTMASLAPDANAISTARGDVSDAISLIRIEDALASGLQLLTQIGGYTFTVEEKALWKSAVDELGFSPVVYLP